MFTDQKVYCREDDNTPKLIYRFNLITINIPAGCFEEINKLVLRFIGKFKGPGLPETISKKKNKAGGVTLPEFKTGYKAPVIKAAGTGMTTGRKTNGTDATHFQPMILDKKV